MKLRSISVRIAALSALCVLLTTGALVGYGIVATRRSQAQFTEQVRDLLDRRSKEALAQLASTQAGHIRSQLDAAFDVARNMARTFEFIASSSEDDATPVEQRRAQVNGILLSMLKDNPGFNGTYSAWEPDGIDGDDRAYKNRTDVGSDYSGRMLAHWTRDSEGHVAMQPLVEYDSRDLHRNGLMKGAWYLGPKEDGQESVLDPLPYMVQGKHLYLATVSVPILINGTFRGVAGVDFDLAFVQKLAADANRSTYDGKGSIAIVNDKGLVVASNEHPELIGGAFEKLDPAWKEDLGVVRSGRGQVAVDAANESIKVFSPVALGRSKSTWSVLVTVPRSVVMAEAFALGTDLQQRSNSDVFWQLIAALSIAVVAVGCMVLLARGIVRPIRGLTDALRAIAGGELSSNIVAARRHDEIGDIARAVEGIREAASASAVHRAEVAEANRRQQEQNRHDLTSRLAHEFEERVGSVVRSVADAAVDLENSAKAMAALAQQSRDRSATVASASETATQSVHSVASASEQLFASIREVSILIGRSGQVIGTADHHAEASRQVVQSLTESAAKIGSVVDLIQSVAAQTNLLALNATIEAARAGEAGRGFAVVANEVKGLAGQTSKATDEIGAQVSAMRQATDAAVAAIGQIRSVVGDIGQVVSSVATAVEEQAEATSKIARSAQSAAQGTEVVSTNIADVSAAVSTTDDAAGKLVEHARSLGRQATELREGLRQFIDQLLAA
jgi:methyl-accepting chemotaxis protein